MAIDSTVGGASANSFMTVVEMAAFAAETVGGGAWTTAYAADVELAEAAMIDAARRISQQRFRGTKAASTQALAFPRQNLTDEDGYAIDSDVIPARVKRAQGKLVLVLVDDATWLEDGGLAGFRRLKVGPLEIETRAGERAGTLPADVTRELQPYIGLGSLNFRIERG